MPSSKSSFRHVIRDRKSSPEIIIVSNENTVFLNPKHLAWKITGTTEMTMSITASTGTMENIGFSSGTATVAISDVPIVLNGSDSTSNPYGFSIAEAIVSKIVTANAARAFGSSLLSNKAASGNMIAQGQSAPCRLAIQTPRNTFSGRDAYRSSWVPFSRSLNVRLVYHSILVLLQKKLKIILDNSPQQTLNVTSKRCERRFAYNTLFMRCLTAPMIRSLRSLIDF